MVDLDTMGFPIDHMWVALAKANCKEEGPKQVVN